MLRKTPKKEVAPSKALQAALQNITETLARELRDCREQAPEWSEFEWAAARAVAASRNWGQQGDWSRLSQGRRILRWLSSRLTRPVTMHAAYAALSYAK
ncbi:MAG: hypothetical protein ACLPWG_25885 [Steroidobacteraceae bacterium]